MQFGSFDQWGSNYIRVTWKHTQIETLIATRKKIWKSLEFLISGIRSNTNWNILQHYYAKSQAKYTFEASIRGVRTKTNWKILQYCYAKLKAVKLRFEALISGIRIIATLIKHQAYFNGNRNIDILKNESIFLKNEIKWKLTFEALIGGVRTKKLHWNIDH